MTDEDWLGQIPPDKPTLIVAEGLLPYLIETEVRRLLTRLTDRFGTGELLADVLSPWGPRISELATSGIVTWGTRDGRELQRWNPRLHYLDHSSAMADYATIPLTTQRILYRVLYAMPAIRDYDRL